MTLGIKQWIFLSKRRMAGQTVTNAAENRDMGVEEKQLTPVLNQIDEKRFRKSPSKRF